MNYMRERFHSKKKKRNVSAVDVNFFQTVREGNRRFGPWKDGGVTQSSGSRSNSSLISRNIVRSTPALQGSVQSSRTVASVLEILDQDIPTPRIDSFPTPRGSSFFQPYSEPPPPKRKKRIQPPPFWDINSGPSSTLPSSYSNHQENALSVQGPVPTEMYIEETVEEECHNIRAQLEEQLRDDSSLEVLAGSTNKGTFESPATIFRENDGLSNIHNSSSLQENIGDLNFSPQLLRGGLVGSGIGQSNPLQVEVTPSPAGRPAPTSGCSFPSSSSPPDHSSGLPPPSSSFDTRKGFFSDATPVAPQQDNACGNKGSFFKIPEMPGSSSSEQYESIFATPRRVTALPRITTPKLFQPYQKTTPSKTTPQTNSTIRTPQSSSRDSFFVISLTEGRGHAVCEVGLAAIDLNHPELVLCQFSDCQTYKKTLSKINIIDPAEMLVPETLKGTTPSVLYQMVTDTFPEMRVVTVKRQFYSAKSGLDTIKSLLLPDLSSLELVILRKYYSLAAAEALMRYIEIKHGIHIAPKTLKVLYQSAKDIVTIDLETCQRLEIVMSNADMVFPEKYSLFGLINHTKTLGGKRRLRINLLQPSCSLDVLRQRQNTVSALVSDQKSLTSLQTNLLKMSGVERLLWLCFKNPNFKNEAKTFETFTNYILLLKASLEALPTLLSILQDISDPAIFLIAEGLSDKRYEDILQKILKMIQEDAKPARGFSEAERQRCFAIKDGINDLLDVARATYSDLIQQVIDNVTELGREHNLPLKMIHSADYGFHPAYVIPKNFPFHKDDLPEVFTDVKLKGRTVHLLTEEIYVFNMRIKRVLQEIQLITNVVIFELVEELRSEVSLIYRLCEHVAELDFLSSLAQVSSTTDFTKPEFSNKINLIGARHPILDYVKPKKPIPNNVFASREKNFNIITGPNMGGKSVYVLMVPLIQIMAQIGCYVPADKAEIRITDHIYVRKGTNDSMECKLSSFMKEINELTYTISNLTESSLIILDEICMGTLTDEGTAVAWGYCEEFLKRSVFTFLTTHYHYLTNLSKIYDNVTNFKMEAIEKPDENNQGYGPLTYTYRLLPGVTDITNYGLRLMLASGFPDSIKQNAIEIVEDLIRKRASALPLVIPETPNSARLHAKIEKTENFIKNLYGLSMTDNFTNDMIATLQRMALEEILSDEDIDENPSGPKRNPDSREVLMREENHHAEELMPGPSGADGTGGVPAGNVGVSGEGFPIPDNRNELPGEILPKLVKEMCAVTSQQLFNNRENSNSVKENNSTISLSPQKQTSLSRTPKKVIEVSYEETKLLELVETAKFNECNPSSESPKKESTSKIQSYVSSEIILQEKSLCSKINYQLSENGDTVERSMVEGRSTYLRNSFAGSYSESFISKTAQKGQHFSSEPLHGFRTPTSHSPSVRNKSTQMTLMPSINPPPSSPVHQISKSVPSSGSSMITSSSPSSGNRIIYPKTPRHVPSWSTPSSKSPSTPLSKPAGPKPLFTPRVSPSFRTPSFSRSIAGSVIQPSSGEINISNSSENENLPAGSPMGPSASPSSSSSFYSATGTPFPDFNQVD